MKRTPIKRKTQTARKRREAKSRPTNPVESPDGPSITDGATKDSSISIIILISKP